MDDLARSSWNLISKGHSSQIPRPSLAISPGPTALYCALRSRGIPSSWPSEEANATSSARRPHRLTPVLPEKKSRPLLNSPT